MIDPITRPTLPDNLTPLAHHFEVSKVCNYLSINCQRSSIMFLTSCAFQEVTGGRMKVSHALDHSSYCIDALGGELTENVVNLISQKVKEYIESNDNIEAVTADNASLQLYFEALNFNDKVRILRKENQRVECVKFRNFLDLSYNAQYQTDIKKLGDFEYKFESPGFFVRYPSLLSKGVLSQWKGAPLQHKLLCAYNEWATKIKSNSIENLNEIVRTDSIDTINSESQKFTKHELTEITENLISQFPAKRIITITGPSSSGKSTFSKFIFDNLKDRGYDCLIISMDDYFVDRFDTPLDEEGKYDFESVHAMHLQLMTDRIHNLLKGETVQKRRYDFMIGRGSDIAEETMKLDQKGFIILEGLNGLNPVILDLLGSETVTKIFVTSMTPIAIDSEHVFRNNDLLLLRRIIRDFNDRGFSIRKNVTWWPDVCVGEARNITPNLRQTNLFFNSALIYELPALAAVGIPLFEKALENVEEDDPVVAQAATTEVRRLLGLMRLFTTISPKKVPESSCIYKMVNLIAEKWVS